MKFLFSKNVLIDVLGLFDVFWEFVPAPTAAENVNAFLAILVVTFASIKLCFAFLVPAL